MNPGENSGESPVNPPMVLDIPAIIDKRGETSEKTVLSIKDSSEHYWQNRRV